MISSTTSATKPSFTHGVVVVGGFGLAAAALEAVLAVSDGGRRRDGGQRHRGRSEGGHGQGGGDRRGGRSRGDQVWIRTKRPAESEPAPFLRNVSLRS